MKSRREVGWILAILGLAISIGPELARAQVAVGQPQGTVIVGQPAAVVVGQPVVVARPGRHPAYQDALGRLRSKHANSRRDGAVTLGRIGDPAAVPDLVWLLQNDMFGEVREAAAFALGAIGDARAANALRAASMQDKNKRVRQAANHAFGKIMFQPPVAVSQAVAVPPVSVSPTPVPERALHPEPPLTLVPPAESSPPLSPPAPFVP